MAEPPTLRCDGTLVTGFNPDDARLLVAAADPEVRDAFGEWPQDEKAALAFIRRATDAWSDGVPHWRFAVRTSASTDLTGYVFLEAEEAPYYRVGYWIASSQRRGGHARRAVAAVCTWLFVEQPDAIVFATIDPANRASRRVVEAVGFRPTGEIERWELRHSEEARLCAS